MNRYFTKTFVRFLVAFLVIIGVAFSVIIFAAPLIPHPVDNVAQTQ